MTAPEPISWECARYYNGKWKASVPVIYRLYANTYVTKNTTKTILRSVSRSEFEAACLRLGIEFNEI